MEGRGKRNCVPVKGGHWGEREMAVVVCNGEQGWQ